jgi:hypothetical protein
MDTEREILNLKRQLAEVMKRPAQTAQRPQVRRATIIELGQYDVHKIEFRDGNFTEDLETNDLTSADRGVPAYVGDDFDRDLHVGTKVWVSFCDGRYWIVAVDELGCRGYCIDDPESTAYVYGWHFVAPALACCPEAGGGQLLTTSDGTTYESATFQCNETGDNRKWVFSGGRLYITPMIDAGSIEYRTEQTPGNCTLELLKYEGAIFPVDDCGALPNSVCLHPLCGFASCSDAPNGTPLMYEATFGGSLEATPVGEATSYNCEMRSPAILFNNMTPGDLIQNCVYRSFYKDIGPMTITLSTNSGTVSISPGGSVSWSLADGVDFDYWGVNVFYLDDDPFSNLCVGFPPTVTVRPAGSITTETNCYPIVVRQLSDDGNAPSSNEEVVCWQMPYYSWFEVTGVTDDSCSDCDVFNAIVKLRRVGSNMISDTDTTTCASGSPFQWKMTFTTINYPDLEYVCWLRVDYDFNYYAEYQLYLGESNHGFNCFGPNVFTLQNNSGDCQNWPATLTVYPIL